MVQQISLEQEVSSAQQAITPARNSVVDGQGAHLASTSAVYARKKRKDKAPICETEANVKDCTEEMLQWPKKKETKGTAKEVQKKPAIFMP